MCSGPTLRGCFLHDAENWEKFPFLEARAIGYRMGPKIGDFSQFSEGRHSSPRKKGEHLSSYLSQQTSRDRYEERCSKTFTLGTNRTIVSDGNLCGLETREGPQPRDPPEAPPGTGGPPGSLGHRDSRRRQIILLVPSVEMQSLL